MEDQSKELSNYQYFKVDLIETEDQVCSLYIIRGFLSESDPKADMDEAVKRIVGDTSYSDFIEHFLDNPWCRVVITNMDFLRSVGDKDSSGLYSVFAKDVTSQVRIVILFGGDSLLSPWSDMASIVAEKYGHQLHQEFIESSLDNPWDRVVIIGINEIPEKLWNGTI